LARAILAASWSMPGAPPEITMTGRWTSSAPSISMEARRSQSLTPTKRRLPTMVMMQPTWSASIWLSFCWWRRSPQ
jgi:hypothetical protein